MVSSGNEKRTSLLAVYQFLEHCFGMYGEKVEAVTRHILDGTSQNSDPHVKETGQLLETLLLNSIEVTKSTLGTAWIRDKEQGQGQPAYESKSEPVPEQRATSTEELSGIFSVLAACAKKCPAFLIHLPAADGVEPENDRLFSRAVESAVSTLTETDFEASRSAILYLLSIAALVQKGSLSSPMQSIVEGVLSRVRRSVVGIVLVGACGTLHPSAIDPAARLLYLILRSSPPDEAMAFCAAAVQQEQFQLIGSFRSTLTNILHRCIRGELGEATLIGLFTDLQELHQVEDVGSFVESDQVLEFIDRYTQLLG